MSEQEKPEKPELWIVADIETSGLDPDCDIYEVAMIAIDPMTLRELGRFEKRVRPQGFKGLNLRVIEMHTESGLWQDLKADDCLYSYDALDQSITHWLIEVYRPLYLDVNFSGTVRLVGNTVNFDHERLSLRCSSLAKWLSHRTINCSTLRDTFKIWAKRDIVDPQKGKHRAMADCEYSLSILRAHRRLMDSALTMQQLPVSRGVNHVTSVIIPANGEFPDGREGFIVKVPYDPAWAPGTVIVYGTTAIPAPALGSIEIYTNNAGEVFKVDRSEEQRALEAARLINVTISPEE
jgi:oligoribonuclease (3'-5' exoribonuclease)